MPKKPSHTSMNLDNLAEMFNDRKSDADTKKVKEPEVKQEPVKEKPKAEPVKEEASRVEEQPVKEARPVKKPAVKKQPEEKRKGRPKYADPTLRKKPVTITMDTVVYEYFRKLTEDRPGEFSREVNVALKAYIEQQKKKK